MKTNILFYVVFLFSTMGYSQIVEIESKLTFTYDNAGNQVTRIFCDNNNNCNAFLEEETDIPIFHEETVTKEVVENLDQSIAVFPNPTKGDLLIKWDQKFNTQINNVDIIDITSRVYKTNYKSGNSQTSIDLSSWPDGLYIVRFYVKGGAILNKKIIKN